MARNNQDVVDTDFEVAPTMHLANSRDPIDETPGVDDKKPVLEKHITNIPQHDHAADTSSHGAHKENLKEKIKKHLPGHHSSENSHEPEKYTADLNKQDSGSSDFEVAGFMPMTTQSSSNSASRTSDRKPRLERHISSIPDDDLSGEEDNGMSGKLRRTISHIAQDD